MAGLVILGIVLIAVDYYFYSWTSYFQPLGCRYKSLGINRNENKLNENYDLVQIGDEIKLNPTYHLEDLNFVKLYSKERLAIFRTFGDIKYKIGFENPEGKFTKVEFGTSQFEDYQKPELPEGETMSTPGYYIRKNIDLMIDEMPLNAAQKDELKGKVKITCVGSLRIDIW